jgi:ATP adenylyltransferase
MIFNKFNLVDNHMLIVTNEFESQYDKLTVADMEATWKSIKELNGLGFFNGGRLAGASQPHKHLQLVPIPLVPDSPFALPIESVLLGSSLPPSVKHSVPFTHPGLPFFNLFALLPENIESDAPQVLHQLYNDMLALAEPVYQKNCIQQPWCFNLLIMKSWMLLVPRSKECVEGTTISVNSMGFAGTLFVKSPEHLEIVKQLGPMGVLQALSLPISTAAL